MSIELSQDELKVIVGILSQVQLAHRDSKLVNPLIDRLDKFIIHPAPQNVEKHGTNPALKGDL